MKRVTSDQGSRVLKTYKQRARWQRIVGFMACLVVFCTVYAMILPAVTLENTSSAVNGTLLEAGSTVGSGDYIIFAESGGSYYALAGDGSAKQVQYDDSTGKVTGADETLVWKYDAAGSLYNSANGNYLQLGASNLVGSKKTIAVDTIGKNSKQTRVSRVTSTTTRYLTMTDGSFKATETRPENKNIYFASVDADEPDPEPDPEPVPEPTEGRYHFDHFKKIDYLGDNDGTKDQKNGDTSLDDNGVTGLDDMYRMYLDITGDSEPVDLLFVIDRSGSMSKTDIPAMSGEQISREEAVVRLINGYGDSQQGFLHNFLDLNEENQVAIATFYGDGQKSGTASEGYTYKTDSSIALNWGRMDSVDASLIKGSTLAKPNGTNYEAGLMRASEMLEAGEVKDNGHKKVMIFISDGVPTYYIGNSGNRRGTGSYGSENNVNSCREPSKVAFDQFRTENPDTLVYTVGVSQDIDGSNTSLSYDPAVLRYMAEQGGGSFYGAADITAMINALKSILLPANVVITDQLSQNVTIHNPKGLTDSDAVLKAAEAKVTCRSGTEETVLYDPANNIFNGDIIKSVTYTSTADAATTGTVTVNFKEGYALQKGTVYTLSFNVQATDAAYDAYATEGYTAAGDSEDEGKTNTDYGGNKTSSGKDGLYSNNSASVSYVVGSKTYTEDYDHPVIQTDKCKLTIKKVKDDGTAPLSGAVFTLKRDGAAVRTYTTDASGTVTIPSEDLTTGSYTLKETTAPDNYVCSGTEISFQVKKGMISHEDTGDADWNWGSDPEQNNIHSNEYSYDLTVKNHETRTVVLQKADTSNHPLNGAKFELYQKAESTDQGAEKFSITGEDSHVYGTLYQGDLVSKQENIGGADIDGIFYHGALPYGTYYLKETLAPDGYQILAEPVVIKISSGQVSFRYRNMPITAHVEGVEANTAASACIQNSSGYVLPAAGGSGNSPYILGGLCLMILAAAVWNGNRRKKDLP